MILAVVVVLAATTQPSTVIAAERAFDADAKALGQWTAFRKYAAPGAILLSPKPTDAATFLAGRKDPPAPVRWQPAQSFLSCDGRSAINTGPWQRPDASHGYFTTVWTRRGNRQWKWLIDLGDRLSGTAIPAPAKVEQVRASCHAPRHAPFPAGSTGARSTDGSLRWWYVVRADGGMNFAADYWAGDHFQPALADQLGPE